MDLGKLELNDPLVGFTLDPLRGSPLCEYLSRASEQELRDIIRIVDVANVHGFAPELPDLYVAVIQYAAEKARDLLSEKASRGLAIRGDMFDWKMGDLTLEDLQGIGKVLDQVEKWDAAIGKPPTVLVLSAVTAVGLATVELRRRKTIEQGVILWKKIMCPLCDRLKNYLKESRVPFVEKDIAPILAGDCNTEDPVLRALVDAFERLGGKTPIIQVGMKKELVFLPYDVAMKQLGFL